jgi:hypothetical protein
MRTWLSIQGEMAEETSYASLCTGDFTIFLKGKSVVGKLVGHRKLEQITAHGRRNHHERASTQREEARPYQYPSPPPEHQSADTVICMKGCSFDHVECGADDVADSNWPEIVLA